MTDEAHNGSAASGPLILYADGASRGNPGPASIGGLVQSADGVVLHEVSERIGIATNNVAEWRAAIAVLEAARRLGATAVELRMDSELVVRQLTGRYQVRNPKLQPLYRRALVLKDEFTRIAIAHVPRALNAHADRLANAALDARPGP
jgi:probable phosphoglycerate mutase